MIFFNFVQCFCVVQCRFFCLWWKILQNRNNEQLQLVEKCTKNISASWSYFRLKQTLLSKEITFWRLHSPRQENLISVVCWVFGIFLFVGHLVTNNHVFVFDIHIYEWICFLLSWIPNEYIFRSNWLVLNFYTKLKKFSYFPKI